MHLEPEVLGKVKGVEEDMKLELHLSLGAHQNDELIWR